jgi:hypothetical protein
MRVGDRARRRRFLLAPTNNVEAERMAMADLPRAGVWAGEHDSDLRALTQDETEILVRAELYARARDAERDEIGAIVGVPRYVRFRDLEHGASRQRGGIDSDPLVRLIAFRAWGDRDRRWFEARGLRADGDQEPGRQRVLIADPEREQIVVLYALELALEEDRGRPSLRVHTDVDVELAPRLTSLARHPFVSVEAGDHFSGRAIISSLAMSSEDEDHLTLGVELRARKSGR